MAASDILPLLLGPSANSIPQQHNWQMITKKPWCRCTIHLRHFRLVQIQLQKTANEPVKKFIRNGSECFVLHQIAEGIGIHVTAALGGDTHNGQQILSHLLSACAVKKVYLPRAAG